MSALAAFDLSVIGTIAPSACTPTLGGGTVDYGTIASSSLSATAYTVLPEKVMSIAISCNAPAKVALMGNSGRPGSLAGALEYGDGQGRAPVDFASGRQAVVGLGLHGTEQIGGYSMLFLMVWTVFRSPRRWVTLHGVMAIICLTFFTVVCCRSELLPQRVQSLLKKWSGKLKFKLISTKPMSLI